MGTYAADGLQLIWPVNDSVRCGEAPVVMSGGGGGAIKAE